MEELVELVVVLLVGFAKLSFKLLAFFVGRLVKLVRSLQGGGTTQDRQEPLRLVRTPAPAKSSTAPKRLEMSFVNALVARGTELLGTARAIGTLARERVATQRFASTFDALIDRTEALLTRIRRADGTHADFDRSLGREETLLAILDAIVSERRGPLVDLLGDTDALASASYAPIVEFCDRRSISLSSDRAATVVGGDKLFFMSVDEPTGLAMIVLPDSFTTEIMTWPAVAHEIAHDFFHSVTSLPTELRRACGLGDDVRLPPVPRTQDEADRFGARATGNALNAWMEELFADAFGTMMLGPAYIETMSASFASPDEPARALAMMRSEDEGAPHYDEHPPGHVRVIVACRLLGRMGYGKEADLLEARWRKLHDDPTVLYAPLIDGRWASLPEAQVLDRAEIVGRTLYMTGLPCLRGLPLRSIAGLDFGPREHEQARRVGGNLASLRPVRTLDARLLVAGAVLATVASPTRAASIYALAREAISGIDAPSRRNASVADDDDQGPLGRVDATAVREALVLREILARPNSRLRQ